MPNNQSKLFEPTVTEKWPKHHRLREPKKKWIEWHEPKTKDFKGILEKIKELGRDTNIVALSGGQDSSYVLHKLVAKDRVDRIFYIKTNTGVQLTEDFVRDIAKSYGLPLDIREPTPNQFIYVALCLQIGFPDHNLHDLVMRLLKYSTIMKYIQEPQFRKKKPVIMSGVRRFESQRRKFNYDQPINIDSGRLWFCCPIFYETNEAVYQYFIKNGLKKSKVYELGSKNSMECNCGTYATKGELELIKKIDPTRYEFLMWIKDGIERFGSAIAKKHNEWGGVGWTDDERQQVLTKYLGDDLQHVKDISQMVCGAECGAGTMRGMIDY